MRNIALTALLLLAGPNDCDDNLPRAPKGERGVDSDGVAYENEPRHHDEDRGKATLSVGTGGINVTVPIN